MSENSLSIINGPEAANMPAHLRDANAAEVNKAAQGGTGGESPNRISLKNSRFRLVVGGEQVHVIDEPFMDVVIVSTNPNTSKAYYGRDYDPNAEDQTPDCYSGNGVVPDPEVERPQCANCAECPMNAWGSKISKVSGAKVKACSDVKRLAVVSAQNPSVPMFQLSVPTASVKVFGNYVRKLSAPEQPIPINGVVTRIRFDPDSDYPKLMFDAVRWLTQEQYELVKGRAVKEQAELKKLLTLTPVPDVIPSAGGGVTAVTTQASEAAAEKAAAEKAAAEKAAAEKAAAEKAAAEKAAAEKAAAEKAAAEKAAVADAWGGQGGQGGATDQTAASGGGDPWAATAGETSGPTSDQGQVSEGNGFADAGWPSADRVDTAPTGSEPPTQEHEESSAQVVEGNSALDAVFAGFDD